MRAHDRLRDVMPSAMQLQPLINLVICPARLSPARGVAMVGGSCSVCRSSRSDLSTIIALHQGLVSNCALAERCFRSDVFPVGSCSFRVRDDDLRPGRTYIRRTDTSQGSDRK